MDFAFAIDPEACVNLPGLRTSSARAAIDGSTLTVDFGELFHSEIALSAVSDAREIPDPRPETYLAMGVSAAVSTLGYDTVTVAGSYQGLVEIDFSQDVAARVRPPGDTPNSDAGEGNGAITFRHLVLSLQDPGSFLDALGRRNQGSPETAARAVSAQ